MMDLALAAVVAPQEVEVATLVAVVVQQASASLMT